jgi:hypothetical protein
MYRNSKELNAIKYRENKQTHYVNYVHIQMKGNKEQREELQQTGNANRECNFMKSQMKI